MEEFYRRGDRFRMDDGDEYVLCRVDMSDVGNEMVMMCYLSHQPGYAGDRWMGGVRVHDDQRITEDEFRQICDGDKFTKITD